MERGTNEGWAPVVPEVRVIDTLDPEDCGIYRALSGGVTSALVLHGSANPIGGQSAMIKTRWGMDESEELLVQGAPRTVKFALGENVTRKGWDPPGPRRFPYSRAGVEQVYVQAFTAAQKYRDRWAEYRQDPDAFPVPPRRDLRLEALVDIMEGRIKVHAHSYRADEILMLMRVAERFGFKIDVFQHVLEGYKVAAEMAAHGAGGSTFSDWWMYKLEAYDAIPYNAAIMHDHGVLTSINSDIPWLQSFMVYEMNKPVRYGGVSKEEALRMLTLYPARQLHIDDRVGSLEVGKDGDLVLLSGSPFDTYSRVEKTVVDGRVYFDLSAQEETRGDPVRELPAIEPDPPAAQFPQWPDAETTMDDLPMESAPTTALTGATVHPVSGPAIEDGVVLMRDGRIAAVGPAGEVEIPADADVMELDGKHVYPGMTDPYTSLGLVEIGAVPASRDDREVGEYNPHIRAVAAANPHSAAIGVARAAGVTTALTSLGSGDVVGTGSVIQLSGDTPWKMSIADRAAVVVDFPSPTGQSWDDPELKGQELEKLVDLFERAELYATRQTVSGDPTGWFEPNVNPDDGVLLEALLPVMRGEMPALFEADSERDIGTLLLFLEEFPQVRAAIVGGDQAYRHAEELAEREIPVIVGSAHSPTSDRDDPVEAGWANAAILNQAGVPVAFSTMDVANVRWLPEHAAKAAAFGLPKDVALESVTLTPARILGLGDEIGSIEAGKRADLIVTDGDPLQLTTSVERAWIAGREVSLESKHVELWKQFRDRPGGPHLDAYDGGGSP
jgi:imidazolonepropionase-like amidohydrolase